MFTWARKYKGRSKRISNAKDPNNLRNLTDITLILSDFVNYFDLLKHLYTSYGNSESVLDSDYNLLFDAILEIFSIKIFAKRKSNNKNKKLNIMSQLDANL